MSIPNSVAKLKRELFVEEYFKAGANPISAAIAAGYSPGSAKVAGWKLMKDPYVIRCIELRAIQVRKRTNITIDAVIGKLWDIVNVDPASLYDDSGRVLPVSLIDETTRRCISSIESEEFGVIGTSKKIKFNDRLKAMDLLTRLLGFVEKKELTVKVTDDRITVRDQRVVFEDASVLDISHEEIKNIDNGSPTE